MAWYGVGREACAEALDGFLKGLEEAEWEILRTYSIGERLINGRIDHFVAHDDKRSMNVAIAGYFLVRDGKIKIWRD